MKRVDRGHPGERPAQRTHDVFAWLPLVVIYRSASFSPDSTSIEEEGDDEADDVDDEESNEHGEFLESVRPGGGLECEAAVPHTRPDMC